MTKRHKQVTEGPILRMRDFLGVGNSITPTKMRLAKIALKIENKGINEKLKN